LVLVESRRHRASDCTQVQRRETPIPWLGSPLAPKRTAWGDRSAPSAVSARPFATPRPRAQPARHGSRTTGLGRFALALCGLAALTACERRSSSGGPALPEAVLVLEVDGAVASRVPASALQSKRSLSELLPAEHRDPEAWFQVLAMASAGRSMSLIEPARRYPNRAIELFRSDGGSFAMGLFLKDGPHLPPAARSLMNQPSPALSDLQLVRVLTRPAAMPSIPPEAPVALRLRVAGRGALTVADEDLASLEFVELRGQGNRARGWRLSDVLDLAVPDLGDASIVVGCDGGEPVEVDRAALSSGAQIHLLKRNKRGQLRLTVLSRDEDGTPMRVTGTCKVRDLRLTSP
jgi:hypothetical protein